MAPEILLPISNSTTGYFVTLISVATELLLLSAMLSLLAFFECRALSEGRTLFVRTHRRRALLLSLVAMLIFVLLETFTSVNTSPTSKKDYANQPCLSITNGAVLARRKRVIEFDEVLFGCMRVVGTNFTVYNGNYSRTTHNITCSDNCAYWYTNGAAERQRAGGDGVRSCHQRFCTIVRAKGDIVFFSEPFREGRPHQNAMMVFFPTQLAFNSSGMLARFAQIAARERASINNEHIQLRSRVFLSAVETRCTFAVSEKSHSAIPMWVCAPTVSVWLISIVTFLVTVFLRGRVFFNMENVSHWAHRTHRTTDNAPRSSATVRCVWEGREQLVYISGNESPFSEDAQNSGS